MKFLVFNIAVVTALGFLFLGNPSDIQHASDKVTRVMKEIKEKVFTVAENKAAQSDKSPVVLSKTTGKDVPERLFQKENGSQKTKQEKVDAFVNKVKEVLKTSPEKNTPISKVTPVTTTKPELPGVEQKTKATNVVQTKNTIKVTATPNKIISSSKTDNIEPKKQTQAQKNNARIRELLAGKPQATAKPESTISHGLMSPQDRRRELMVLADDMELVHAQSLEN